MIFLTEIYIETFNAYIRLYPYCNCQQVRRTGLVRLLILFKFLICDYVLCLRRTEVD